MIVCSDAAVPGQLVVTARRAHGPASQVVGHSELPIRQPILQLERSRRTTQYVEIAYCITLKYSSDFGYGYRSLPAIRMRYRASRKATAVSVLQITVQD